MIFFFRELEQKRFLRSTCLVNIFIWLVSLNQHLESLASASAAPNQKCADPLSGMPPTTLYLYLNRLRSIYQYSNMAPRLSGQTSIFGVVFFVSKSLLGIEGQKKLRKKNLQFWPEILGAMFEYWYIDRGLLDKYYQTRLEACHSNHPTIHVYETN